MPRKQGVPLADMVVKAEDCYDPSDYVMVHQDYLTRLKDWIREEGERNDTCTYDILGKQVCGGCRCPRKPADSATESQS